MDAIRLKRGRNGCTVIRLKRGRNRCTVIRLKREGMDALLLD